jgi:HD superfamily phosphohydrolase YqeK
MEPARTFFGVEKFRRVVRKGHLQEAALLDAGWVIDLLQRLNWPVHPNLQQSYERLSAHLQVDEAFFARE